MFIDERQADQHQYNLSDVTTHEIEHEFAEVEEDASTLSNGNDDGGKVVIGEDDFGGLLGDIGPVLSHGYADVTAQRLDNQLRVSVGRKALLTISSN